jgi:hypothetical protein
MELRAVAARIDEKIGIDRSPARPSDTDRATLMSDYDNFISLDLNYKSDFIKLTCSQIISGAGPSSLAVGRIGQMLMPISRFELAHIAS